MFEPLPDPLNALQSAFDEVLPDAQRVLRPEDDLVDLGVGSIAALEMAGVLQTRFGIVIADSDLYELRTVADFMELIRRQLPSG